MFNMGDMIWPILLVILYVVAGMLVLILLISLIDKCVKYFTLKTMGDKWQKGELIKKKMFICQDKYELRWMGEINPTGKYILIGIHDYKRTRKDFDKLMLWMQKNNKDISVVSFDQRNCAENIKDVNNYNLGFLIKDIKEMTVDLSEKYPDQKIILLGEGYGAAAALACSNLPEVHKIIANSVRLIDGYKKPFTMKLSILSGWLFSSKKTLPILASGADLSSDTEFAKNVDSALLEDRVMTIREYYQIKTMLKKGIKNFNNSPNSKALLIQSGKDAYSNPKKYTEFINKLDSSRIKVNPIKDFKHFIMNEPKNESVFNLIKDFVLTE